MSTTDRKLLEHAEERERLAKVCEEQGLGAFAQQHRRAAALCRKQVREGEKNENRA